MGFFLGLQCTIKSQLCSWEASEYVVFWMAFETACNHSFETVMKIQRSFSNTHWLLTSSIASLYSMTIKLIEVIRFNQNTVTASHEGQTLASSQYRRGKALHLKYASPEHGTMISEGIAVVTVRWAQFLYNLLWDMAMCRKS